ncbi:hypothetical protein EKG37_05535 [Robertmurraya yapensis]|uniref:Uncharacterized protein n=1 Tax=Bacillus yapensis TaxID=2492960 RepID=A0A3S0J0G2_9BACI|nr:hypothetical protein [Bacillus yapensis]RTR35340.1 hypothetical protein EKG37_05535 [Bacillus yapensis]TKS97849.1 hypothetical protein FAR12_05535 [Bacillus yapensis]
MDHDEYKAYLKQQYSHEIRPLQSVNDVISAFQKKLDIAETELSESEAIFLKMTIPNYINAHKNNPIKSNLDNLNFISYGVVRNEKSDHYYNHMRISSGNERILVIIESQLNAITSNCEKLKVDMLIERGIDTSHVNQETPEFFAYLMLFDSYKENHWLRM